MSKIDQFWSHFQLNQFLVNVLILYRLKKPENLWFSDVFREYKIGTLTRNGLILGQRDSHWAIKKMISSSRTCLFQYLNENPFYEHIFGAKFELKELINFSFAWKLVYVVHNQVWSSKRWKGAIKVLQRTWTLHLVALNRNMLYSFIVLWFRSKFWAKLIVFGLIFIALLSQIGLIRSIEKGLSLVILNKKNVFCHSSGTDFDLGLIIFSFNLEFIVWPSRFSLEFWL